MSADGLDVERLRRGCAQCSLHVLCLPAGIGGADLARALLPLEHLQAWQQLATAGHLSPDPPS